MPVVHLRKQLCGPPVVMSVAGVDIRPMVVPQDVDRWLALRDRAIAHMSPAVRTWTREDFHTEMTSKPWWCDERTWLATFGELRSSNAPGLIGAVTLAERAGRVGTVAVVHWLMVDPAWRRRGIGRMLLTQLERAAWAAGWREVQLETHSSWTAAAAFYQAMGYQQATAEPP